MTREKITLGGFEQWVEYNPTLCSVTLFGFETAKHGLILDVKNGIGNKRVNGFIGLANNFGSGSIRLTKQEEQELNEYINKKDLDLSN